MKNEKYIVKKQFFLDILKIWRLFQSVLTRWRTCSLKVQISVSLFSWTPLHLQICSDSFLLDQSHNASQWFSPCVGSHGDGPSSVVHLLAERLWEVSCIASEPAQPCLLWDYFRRGAGGQCKGSHGEDPLWTRNAGQVRGGERGEAGGTLWDGAGAFVSPVSHQRTRQSWKG